MIKLTKELEKIKRDKIEHPVLPKSLNTLSVDGLRTPDRTVEAPNPLYIFHEWFAKRKIILRITQDIFPLPSGPMPEYTYQVVKEDNREYCVPAELFSVLLEAAI